jgi:hypothetical protein
MMKLWDIRRLMFLTGAMVPLAAPIQSACAETGSRQACTGVLIRDKAGYLLKEDAGSKSLWCDAYIGEGENLPLVRRVLKTCPLGSRCRIAGLFQGHGIFYWRRIWSISLLPR